MNCIFLISKANYQCDDFSCWKTFTPQQMCFSQGRFPGRDSSRSKSQWCTHSQATLEAFAGSTWVDRSNTQINHERESLLLLSCVSCYGENVASEVRGAETRLERRFDTNVERSNILPNMTPIVISTILCILLISNQSEHSVSLL